MAGELMSGADVMFSYGGPYDRIEMRRRRNSMNEATAYEVWVGLSPEFTGMTSKSATKKFVELCLAANEKRGEDTL